MSQQTMQTYFESKAERNIRQFSVLKGCLYSGARSLSKSFDERYDVPSMAVNLLSFAMIGAELQIPKMDKAVPLFMKTQKLITMYNDGACSGDELISLVDELMDLGELFK